MEYWHGDEWRWNMRPEPSPSGIAVIEPPKGTEPKAGHKIPFGFAREIEPDECEPLLWEGD
jgi:hypothetical protein